MSEAPIVTFEKPFVLPITEREKTLTARWQFEHEFEPGDEIRLATPDGNVFAHAVVVAQGDLRADWFTYADFSGHKRYLTTSRFLEELNGLYETDFQPFYSLDILFFWVTEVLADG